MRILSLQKQKKHLNAVNQEINTKHSVVYSPNTTIELLSYQQLSEQDKTNLLNNNNIAITSQNAAFWLVSNLKHWAGYIYTNSPKSKEILDIMPHANIKVSDNSYAQNLGFLIQDSHVDAYLHLTGNLGLDDLEDMASKNGIKYNRLEVYKTSLTPIKLDLEEVDVCIFTSPSQVDSFFSVNTWKKSIFALCIGKTTAQSLLTYGVKRENIYFPDQANYLSMIELLPKIEERIEQQKTK